MKSTPLILMSLFTVLLFSCKDNEDATPKTPITIDEQELITTVKLNFTDSEEQLQTFIFSQPDGFGGNPPSIDTIILQKGMSYQVETEFWDESNPNDKEDITQEIKEKDSEHLLCFETKNIDGMDIKRTDTDGVYEVGLSSQWTLSEDAISNNGSITLTLKHQVGVKDGSCEAGETDVEVTFEVRVK